MKRCAIILAGGTGERFWPASRKSKPKQLLKLVSDKTMIEDTIDRIAPLFPYEDIFIVTSNILLEPIRRVLKIIPPENIIAEPFKRNTAPAIALGIAFILEKYKNVYNSNEISISILTADHIIKPNSEFVLLVNELLNFVENNNYLGTIGIVPTRPETGFGYIEYKELLSEKNNIKIFKAQSFKEKPNKELAEIYVSEGNYLWNSGMFFWNVETFLTEINRALPEVGDKIPLMINSFKNKTNIALAESLESLYPIFEQMPNISIDYGLMEKATNVAVAQSNFVWDDLGSWDSLQRINPADPENNLAVGNTTYFECENSILVNLSEKNNIKLATFGVNNLVIVITDDVVLVCPKDQVQKVKNCVELLSSNNEIKYL